MTTWTVVDDHEGVVLHISDAGREKCAEEQRLSRLDRLYVEIKLGALGGALLTIAGLVLVKLFGA